MKSVYLYDEGIDAKSVPQYELKPGDIVKLVIAGPHVIWVEILSLTVRTVGYGQTNLFVRDGEGIMRHVNLTQGDHIWVANDECEIPL